MREEIANETVLDEAVAYIRDSHIDSEIARSKGPYEHHNDILECNTMTLAVMVRGVCIAHIMMMERTHPFSDLDREAFVRLQVIGEDVLTAGAKCFKHDDRGESGPVLTLTMPGHHPPKFS